MRAFVFPGQGSQKVGMGVELAAASPAAREVFQEVDEALGQKLFKLMQEGPESDLTLTENAQPALMAVSGLFTGTRWEGNLTELEMQWGRTIGQLPSPYTKANPLVVPYSFDQGP